MMTKQERDKKIWLLRQRSHLALVRDTRIPKRVRKMILRTVQVDIGAVQPKREYADRWRR